MAAPMDATAVSPWSLASQKSLPVQGPARGRGPETRWPTPGRGGAPAPAERPPGRPAVLLDALGTLLFFEPPAPRLQAVLRARAGVHVDEAEAEAAMRAEIRFYRAHLHEGRDAASLALLRRRSAEAMRPALPPAAAALPLLVLTDALLDALVFRAYPEVPAALADLRTRGVALVVVSNWDFSLHERLAETGLAPLVDAAGGAPGLGAGQPGAPGLPPPPRPGGGG